MKYVTLLIALVLMISYSAQAQNKVRERNLKGTWKMVFDIDEDELEDELKDDDLPLIGRVFAKSVTSLVFGIIDEIDIEMQFQDHNRLKLIIDAFGEREVEYGRWYIDDEGALRLDDFDNISVGDDDDDNDIWLMKGDRLVAYEQHGSRLDRKPVYMRRMY